MQERKYHFTLRARVFISFTALLLALISLISAGHFQSSYIVNTLEDQGAAFHNISQLMIYVEDTLNTMREYNWDYDDPDSFSEMIESDRVECGTYLSRLDLNLDNISEEQYLLTRSVKAVYGYYDAILQNIINYVHDGMHESALNLYNSEAQSCGYYLVQYVQQLLETAIADSQSTYASLTSLGTLVNRIQTVLAVCCLILGALLAREVLRILNPLQKLSEASHAISNGEYNGPDLPEDRKDEVGDVERAFNQMKHSTADQVQTLNDKNLIEHELHEQEKQTLRMQNLAEREKLQQLRSQVDPHFLFNTLNIIAITASNEDAPRTQQLITDLSAMLRYSLLSNDVWVPLSQEILIINRYYDIFHTRFGERVALRWQIADDIDVTETKVPSLILQPLVENAFRHGITPKEEGGSITIRIRRLPEYGMLYLCVSDNGCGIENGELIKLRASLRNAPLASPEGEHIGLSNVASRLNLIDERCRMVLSSHKGKGTRASVFIPLVEEEEEEDV